MRIVFDIRDLLQLRAGEGREGQLFFFFLSMFFASVHEWINDK